MAELVYEVIDDKNYDIENVRENLKKLITEIRIIGNGHLNYDVTDGISYYDSKHVDGFKEILNKLFTYAKCNKVVVNHDNDKMFFGIRVYPILDANDLYKRICEKNQDIEREKPIILYNLEIDCKVFDIGFDLTEEEIAAWILYSIDKISYIDLWGIMDIINTYFAHTDYPIASVQHSKVAKELIAYGVSMTMSKKASINGLIDDALSNDMYSIRVHSLFLEKVDCLVYLNELIRKIIVYYPFMRKRWDRRDIIMTWVLSVIVNYDTYRIPAYKTLKTAAELTGSKCEWQLIEMMAHYIESKGIHEAAFINTHTGHIDLSHIIKPLKMDLVEKRYKLAHLDDETDVKTLSDMLSDVTANIILLDRHLDNPDLDEYHRQLLIRTKEDYYAVRQIIADRKDKLDRMGGELPETIMYID